MKIIFLIFFIFSAAISVFSQQVDIDEEIRIETSVVVVPVQVTDRSDKNIPDLTKADFRVFENKIEREIIGFEDAFAPFTIALALDISDSTKFQLSDIKRAAVAFLKELPPADRLIIYTFDSHLYKIADVKNSDFNSAQNSIAFSFTGGKTALYDSIGKIVGEDFKKIGGKKALILFTDGVDTDSRRETYQSSLRLAQESGVLTFPIQYNTLEDIKKEFGDGSAQLVTSKGEALSTAYIRAAQHLRLLAGGTGGDFYYADTIANLENTFSKIAKQLSQIYSLSFYPNDELNDKKRKVKIEVKIPQAVVKTRKIYYLNGKTEKKD